jgi:ABC-type transporter Mla subunit MlaD
MPALALVTAVALLVLWFPMRTLWHQQSELDSTASQIASIQRQGQSLSAQAKSVSSKAAATLLAREQYQLVSPGQSLIQVLPGNGSGYVSANQGDPGFQPLVSPLSSSSLTSDPALATTSKHAASESFLARFVRTLEFWR